VPFDVTELVLTVKMLVASAVCRHAPPSFYARSRLFCRRLFQNMQVHRACRQSSSCSSWLCHRSNAWLCHNLRVRVHGADLPLMCVPTCAHARARLLRHFRRPGGCSRLTGLAFIRARACLRACREQFQVLTAILIASNFLFNAFEAQMNGRLLEPDGLTPNATARMLASMDLFFTVMFTIGLALMPARVCYACVVSCRY
jgi:hypothetical protein